MGGRRPVVSVFKAYRLTRPAIRPVVCSVVLGSVVSIRRRRRRLWYPPHAAISGLSGKAGHGQVVVGVEVPRCGKGVRVGHGAADFEDKVLGPPPLVVGCGGLYSQADLVVGGVYADAGAAVVYFEVVGHCVVVVVASGWMDEVCVEMLRECLVRMERFGDEVWRCWL
ncbi:hypothetical protein DFP73DRAFT_552228 [Morchella snyderi]|nr:hypothetical protein DFP73DRAFT_552228 [Morchella snyderi]